MNLNLFTAAWTYKLEEVPYINVLSVKTECKTLYREVSCIGVLIDFF